MAGLAGSGARVATGRTAVAAGAGAAGVGVATGELGAAAGADDVLLLDGVADAVDCEGVEDDCAGAGAEDCSAELQATRTNRKVKTMPRDRSLRGTGSVFVSHLLSSTHLLTLVPHRV
jgi:hypothetical protein